MRVRSKYVAVGIVVAVVVLLLTVNFTAWNVLSGPMTQGAKEGDPPLDDLSIPKPGEATDFLPTPFTSAPLPKEAIAVTPGQPRVRDFRASPENLARIQPDPTIRPGEPVYLVVQPYIMPIDSKQMAFLSDLVVLVHAIESQARWSTDDGMRPANPHSNSDKYIYTATSIKINQVLSGDVAVGDILPIRQNGGQVGEDRLIIDDGYPPLVIGQYLLLYLTKQVHPETQELYYSIQDRYVVDEAMQMVTNPFFSKSLATIYDEIKEVQEMKQAIREGRFTPPPPPTSTPLPLPTK